jgi:hypothetical protein
MNSIGLSQLAEKGLGNAVDYVYVENHFAEKAKAFVAENLGDVIQPREEEQ